MTATVPPAELDALVTHVATRLAAAATDRTAPWRTPMLATVSAGTPTLRTVVLRSVAPTARKMLIHTDRNSGKARQIAQNPAVELCFWDPVAREQLRVAGRASVATVGAGADAAWSALPPESRAIYRAGPAPGTPTSATAPVDHAPADPGGGSRAAFAVIAVLWQSWDWVWLGTDAHRRARLCWRTDGSHVGGWTVP